MTKPEGPPNKDLEKEASTPETLQEQGTNLPDYLRPLSDAALSETLAQLHSGNVFQPGRESGSSVSSSPEEPIAPEDRETGEPTVKVDFYFANHATAEDWGNLQPQIDEADVVLLEGIGWSAELQQDYEDISFGRDEPAPGQPKEAMHAIQHMIHETGKPIEFIDLPHPSEAESREEQETIQEMREALKDKNMGVLYFFDGEHDNALGKTRDAIKRMTAADQKREAYMVQQIQKQTERIRTGIGNDDPRYKNVSDRQNVKAKVILGASHTRVRRELKRQGTRGDSKLSRKTFTFSGWEEASRRATTNGSDTISDELLYRTCVESSVIGLLADSTEDTNERIQAASKILEGLTVEDYQHISETLGQTPREQRTAMLGEILDDREEAPKIPRTSTELHNLIGS